MENKQVRMSIKSRITKNGKRMFESDAPGAPPTKKSDSKGGPTEKFTRHFEVPANAFTLVKSVDIPEENHMQIPRSTVVKAVRFNANVADVEKRRNSIVHSILAQYNPSTYDDLLQRIYQVLRMETLEECFEEQTNSEENVTNFLKTVEEKAEAKKFVKNIEELRRFMETRNFLFAQGGDDQVARNTSFGYRKGILSITNFLKDRNASSLNELLTLMLTDSESFPALANHDEKICEDRNFFFFKRGEEGNLIKCDRHGNEFTKKELRLLILQHPQIFAVKGEEVNLAKGVGESPSFWVSSAQPDFPESGTRDYSRVENLECEIFVVQDHYALAKVVAGPYTGQSVYILPSFMFNYNTDFLKIFRPKDKAVIRSCITLNYKNLFTACEIVSHAREGVQLVHEGMRRMRHKHEPNVYDDVNEGNLRNNYRTELKKIRFMDRVLSGKFVPPRDVPFVKMSTLKKFVETRVGLFFFEGQVPRCRTWNFRRKFINLIDAAYVSNESLHTRSRVAGRFRDNEMKSLLDLLLVPIVSPDGVKHWILKGSFDQSSKIYVPNL